MRKGESPERKTGRDLYGKRRDILAGARRAFARKGYDGTSIDDVIAEAKVARRTLYLHFTGKEDLFAALIKEQCDAMIESLSLGGENTDPQEVLTRFGNDVVEVTLAPESLDLYRLVVAESKRFPELGQAFYRSGHETSAPILAKYLAEQTRAGILAVSDPRYAADQFFAMISTTLRIRRLLRVASKTSAAERQKWVEQTVSFFLAACGYRGSAKTVRPRERANHQAERAETAPQ